MSRPEYIIGLHTLLVCVFVLCCSLSNTVSAQLLPSTSDSSDQVRERDIFLIVDSFKKRFDSLSPKKLVTNKTLIKTKLASTSADVSKFRLDRKLGLQPLNEKGPIPPTQLLGFDGGMASYQFSYRSSIDTPFIERNIQQHTLAGHFRFTVQNVLPITVTYYLRNTNSSIFRDIYDVRIQFDAYTFRNSLQKELQNRISSSLDQFTDPVLEKWHETMLNEWNSIKQYFNSTSVVQQLIEANKILKIPAFTYDLSLPDSLAKMKSDSLQSKAKRFLDEYKEKKAYIDSLSGKLDSIKREINKATARVNQLKNISSGQFKDWSSYKSFRKTLNEKTGTNLQIPKKYQWLLGIRQLGLGRNQINYSELTTKNLSVSGINFEYNSWYYVAVVAGLVDYRFRDFALHPMRRTKQYMYLARLGVGQLNRNYFIVSAFKGQKQLYTTSANARGLNPVAVSGLNAETKWRIARNIYVQGEVAQSFSADFRSNPPSSSKSWDFSDNTNKAYALKWYSYFAKTGSRIEAMYKYAGSNYQSFSSFQTNSAVRAWNVKAEQYFFKKQLRITGTLRSSDFTNPYIIQNYSSNSTFKSIYASYRRKKSPTISIGYLPASQLTKLDNQLFENRFYTFNTGINHFYKVGLIKGSSTLIYNRFYNNSSDTGFIYFNAISLFAAQSFFFKHFTATLNMSSTSNSTYKLIVLDENIQFNLFNWGGAGCGIKVNMLNRQTPRLGFYGNFQVKVNRQDIVYVSYDQGYLPGLKSNLVHNDFAHISFIKYFK